MERTNNQKNLFFKKIDFQLLLLLLIPFCTCAQKIQIEGRVKDAESNNILPFASVSLYNSTSNELPVIGAYVMENGKFILEKLFPGEYTLKIQLMGFVSKEKRIVLTPAKEKNNLGTILLKEKIEELETVIIKTKKGLVENKFEKEIINISKDNRVSTANLSLIIENSPNVTIDPLKGLTINGDDNIKILVNGVWRGEESGKEVLNRLNPMNVEKIEVITNPASRYGSDGTAGIINVIMKKNETFKKYLGLNAKVATLPNRGVNLNFGTFTKRLGFHGIYNYDFFKQVKTAKTNTKNLLENVRTIQRNNIEEKNHTHQALLGINYALSDKTSMNTQIEYTNSNILNQQNIDFTYTYPNQTITNIWNTEGDYSVETINYGLDIAHKTKKNGFLNFNLNYLNGTFGKNYFISNNTNNTFIRGNDDRNNGELRFLYKSPKINRIKYEVGATYNFRLLDYRLGEDELNGAVIDITNVEWGYDEKIMAFFSDIYYTYNNWKVRFGGRLENTNIEIAEGLANQTYLKFFPSLQFDKKLKGNHRISFGYSRRINRPRPHQINSIPSLTDPNNIRQGNAALQPELSHNVNFRYQGKIGGISTVITPYYKHIKDAIQLIASVDEEVTITSYENVKSIENIGVSMQFRFSLLQQLKSNLILNPFYTKLKGKSIGNEGLNYSFRFNNTLKLPRDFTFGAYYYYYAQHNILQGVIEPIYQFDFTLNKSFPKSNIDISVEVRDVFNTKEVGIEASEINFNRDILRKPKTSYLIFGITYRPKLASKKSRKLSRNKIYSKEEIE